jgi:hypothetical protein
MYNEKRNCRPGMMEAVWLEAGVNCEVLRGGTLREGDEVKLKPHSFKPDKIDPGLQSSGFFTSPSKRTAQMVRARAPCSEPADGARLCLGATRFKVSACRPTCACTQVKDGVATNKRSFEAALRRGDTEGMRRAEASYGSVGLAFYPSVAAKSTTGQPMKPKLAGERRMGVGEACVIVLLPVAVLLCMWRPWEQQP